MGKVTTPLPPSYALLSWPITQPRLEGSMVPPRVSTLNWYVWWMVCKTGMGGGHPQNVGGHHNKWHGHYLAVRSTRPSQLASLHQTSIGANLQSENNYCWKESGLRSQKMLPIIACSIVNIIDGNLQTIYMFDKVFASFSLWHAKICTQKKMHIYWHAQFRSQHIRWEAKKKNTRQLTCLKLKWHVILGNLSTIWENSWGNL